MDDAVPETYAAHRMRSPGSRGAIDPTLATRDVIGSSAGIVPRSSSSGYRPSERPS